MILLLLLTQLAGADCDRSKIQGTNKCQLCFVDSKNIQFLGNPWDPRFKLTEKEQTAAALNSVMCSMDSSSLNFKNLVLPSQNSKIEDIALFNSIEKIYLALGNSNANNEETAANRATGCFDYGTKDGFSKRNLNLGVPSYLAKMLNSCLVKSGGDFKSTYCIDISKRITSFGELKKGLVGLLRKRSLITQSQAKDLNR
ncbi:MAG: hypothetical protein KA715_03380 [Xanthomonadaceae bacterium]|nr:hypothetical protein [Xanthomonadaceae bacterium]